MNSIEHRHTISGALHLPRLLWNEIQKFTINYRISTASTYPPNVNKYYGLSLSLSLAVCLCDALHIVLTLDPLLLLRLRCSFTHAVHSLTVFLSMLAWRTSCFLYGRCVCVRRSSPHPFFVLFIHSACYVCSNSNSIYSSTVVTLCSIVIFVVCMLNMCARLCVGWSDVSNELCLRLVNSSSTNDHQFLIDRWSNQTYKKNIVRSAQAKSVRRPVSDFVTIWKFLLCYYIC